MFPLPPPDSDTVKAQEKAWKRQDLTRYLQRWEGCELPEIPEAFFAFGKRACDVGCGIGKFILTQSEAHPDWAFLGIDKGSLRAGKMHRRLKALPRPNLFGIHANAIPVLARMPANSLDLLTIFYPNPWWPNKHRQKRWAFHPLLPQLVELMRPGGQLILTSNEAFYLAEFAYAMAHHPRVHGMALTYAGPIRESEGRTHFETKFLGEGTPCGQLTFQKDPAESAVG